MPERLHNLRNEEERQLHRVLFQNTMRILEQQRVIAVTLLEESDGQHRRDGRPEQQVLQNRDRDWLEQKQIGFRTLMSLLMLALYESPMRKRSASGQSRTSLVLERTSRVTSPCKGATLKRSDM